MHLTEDQLKIITDRAIKAYQDHATEQDKQRHDRRLHNIKLLLKNYRALVLHCEKLKDDLEELEDTSIQDLDIETINLESIESIKQSKTKSIAMVYFIQGKMEAYRRSCSKDELKYYRVLEKKYITARKYSTREIAEAEHIDERTARRYLEKAVSDLPVIFFGFDAIKFKK